MRERSGKERREPLKVLLVEDDPAHAELIRRNLEEQGFAGEIEHVTDGEAALDFLFRRNGWASRETRDPDLVLLDIRLPRMTGLEVLEAIRGADQLSAMPTVMLTTSEADADIRRAYSLRANSYLVKPLDPERFRALLRSLGLFWTLWSELPRSPMTVGP